MVITRKIRSGSLLFVLTFLLAGCQSHNMAVTAEQPAQEQVVVKKEPHSPAQQEKSEEEEPPQTPIAVSPAETIPAKSKADLIKEADLIILGTVTEISEERWNNPNFERGSHIINILVSDVAIEADEVFKGELEENEEVTVRINNGLGSQHSPPSVSYPRFGKEEQALLFLRKIDGDTAINEEDYYVVHGAYQGKFIYYHSVPSGPVFSNGKEKLINS